MWGVLCRLVWVPPSALSPCSLRVFSRVVLVPPFPPGVLSRCLGLGRSSWCSRRWAGAVSLVLGRSPSGWGGLPGAGAVSLVLGRSPWCWGGLPGAGAVSLVLERPLWCWGGLPGAGAVSLVLGRSPWCWGWGCLLSLRACPCFAPGCVSLLCLFSFGFGRFCACFFRRFVVSLCLFVGGGGWSGRVGPPGRWVCSFPSGAVRRWGVGRLLAPCWRVGGLGCGSWRFPPLWAGLAVVPLLASPSGAAGWSVAVGVPLLVAGVRCCGRVGGAVLLSARRVLSAFLCPSLWGARRWGVGAGRRWGGLRWAACGVGWVVSGGPGARAPAGLVPSAALWLSLPPGPVAGWGLGGAAVGFSLGVWAARASASASASSGAVVCAVSFFPVAVAPFRVGSACVLSFRGAGRFAAAASVLAAGRAASFAWPVPLVPGDPASFPGAVSVVLVPFSCSWRAVWAGLVGVSRG